MPPTRIDSYDWQNHTPVDRAVLCFIRRGSEILLIHKLRGLGMGKINGPGGRLEPGETPFQAAVRETEEEVGLTPEGLHHAGELSFLFADGYSLDCSVITATGFRGRLLETEEAIPFWCPIDEIPFERMWSDDRLWIPHMLEALPFRGYFIFDGDEMIDQRLLTGDAAALSKADLATR